MTGTAQLSLAQGREFTDYTSLSAGIDRVFRGLVIFAMLLEIVVFVEPAPVDVMLLLCLTLGLIWGKLKFTQITTLPLVGLAGFALFNLISMADAYDPERAVWYVFVTLYLIVSWFLFVGLMGRYGKPMVATLLYAYCAAGVISAFLGAGGYLHFLPYQDILLLNQRARGLFKDCNVYGPYFVPIVMLALVRSMGDRTLFRSKIAWLTLFFTALIGMFLSFSRACWLNCAVTLVVLFAVQQIFMSSGAAARRRLRVGAFVVVAGALCVLILINVPSVKQMLAIRVTSNGLQDYDRVRFATQDLASRAAEEHPLGIGPGQAELIFGYATHSMYMRILSENGVLALAALLVFIAITTWRALKNIRYGRDEWMREVNLVVFACIIGHLVNSLFIDTVHWRHIWFIYALPWAPMRTTLNLPRAARAAVRRRTTVWNSRLVEVE